MSTLKALLKENVLDLKKILNCVEKYSKYPKLFQTMLKKVSNIWSQDDDSRRVLALLILMKSLKKDPDYFSTCSRGMYLTYIKNSKFIYGNNIGKNNFMRSGLIEIYSLQADEAYKHAFVFIRQLAITLRKAYVNGNKEDTRAVYNWQFICSLKFWCAFVARNAQTHELVQTLIHPLVQIILGTVRLNPGSRWISLRFHCIECLHTLAGVDSLRRRVDEQGEEEVSGHSKVEKSKFSTILVPSLPLLLDVFRLFDFNKRAAAASKAPMDLRLMLHFSPSQRKETACMDAVSAWLHDLLTESLVLYASSVAFPEYSSPVVTEVRAYLKTCRVANFTRDFKSLLNKIREHSEFVQKKRQVIKTLTDNSGVIALENILAQSDSPLVNYYFIHRKLRIAELTRLADRFKSEGKLDEEDPFEDTGKSKSSTKSSKKARDDKVESESESDADSDASYDYDDGTTVTHVSKSEAKKDRKKDEDSSGEDEEFDLEKALDEADEEMGSEHSDEEQDDEVTDFKLDDSEEDDDDDAQHKVDLELSDGENDNFNVDLDSLSEDDDEDDDGDEDVDMVDVRAPTRNAIPKPSSISKKKMSNNKKSKKGGKKH